MKREHRGYCGIGIIKPKTLINLGSLWRSAYCLGADFIFTIGDRYHRQASDTVAATKHVPYWRFTDFEDFHAHIPFDCQLVGVEICREARPLESFIHPERAIYLLGPEDGSLPTVIAAECQHLVQFTSRYCLNVAAAGSIVLYDRQLKQAT